MKIAIPYQNGQVFPHFGHAPQFKFYTIESGMILHTEVVETAGSGHSAVTAFLMRGGIAQRTPPDSILEMLSGPMKLVMGEGRALPARGRVPCVRLSRKSAASSGWRASIARPYKVGGP